MESSITDYLRKWVDEMIQFEAFDPDVTLPLQNSWSNPIGQRHQGSDLGYQVSQFLSPTCSKVKW